MGLIIDKSLCTACEACVDECPFGALELVDDLVQVNENCNLCRACLDVCPVEAISLEEGAGEEKAAAQEGRGVWVFAEQRAGRMPEVVAELLGQGRRLADELGVELGAVILGAAVEDLAPELFALGADVVYMAADERLKQFNDDIYCEVLARFIKVHKPEALLAGATSLGRSLIPRVATAVSTGLTADCTGLAIDKEKRLLLQTRPAFGGNIMATIICPRKRPQIATVRPRVMKKQPRQEGRQGRLVKMSLNGVPGPATDVLQVVEAIDEQVNLTGAEVVVVGGRGLGGPEGFDLVAGIGPLPKRRGGGQPGRGGRGLDRSRPSGRPDRPHRGPQAVRRPGGLRRCAASGGHAVVR